MQTETRPQARLRSAFKAFVPITTRWSDNDVYGHINNVTYYSFFDTAINGWLIGQGVLDIEHGELIGLVVQTHCDYFAPLAFPQALEAGIAVTHVGNSSVRYEIGIFAQGQALCAAHGHFVHVYVDRVTRKPRALGDMLRGAVMRLNE
jgi:acyl-CoA thioester hydrolase